MSEWFKARQIIRTDLGVESVLDVAFLYNDVLFVRSAKGWKLGFDNKAPKTQIHLRDGSTLWVLARFERVLARLEAYHNGTLETDDIPQPSDN
ncbi:hypothetical protein [Hymenobacter koreensis]|uniref:Uncharacterized protein n=1 Tax=Hymenobacter koreensis TaxID=1084523 RepID=A0ABP8JKL3_9BACT